MFNFKELFTVSLILFSIIDMVGNIPNVIVLKKKIGSIQSGKATIASGILMILFLYGGDNILSLLGVDVASFALAGSIIIFLIGMEMILGLQIFHHAPEGTSSASIVPLAFPLIAGAGTLTTILSLKATYSSLYIFLGIIINLIFVYIILKSSSWLESKIGANGFNVIRRIFGIILISIAIRLFKNYWHQ